MHIRGVVESEVFATFGRPVYFDRAVDMVVSRVVPRLGQQGSENQVCEQSIQRMVREEAQFTCEQ